MQQIMLLYINHQCRTQLIPTAHVMPTKLKPIIWFQEQEAQLLQTNSTSVMHVILGWLTDHAIHW